MVAIGECSSQRDSTSLGIHRTTHSTDASLLFVGLSVVQAEPHRWSLADKCRDGAVLADQIERLIFANAEIDVHLRVIGHRY